MGFSFLIENNESSEHSYLLLLIFVSFSGSISVFLRFDFWFLFTFNSFDEGMQTLLSYSKNVMVTKT